MIVGGAGLAQGTVWVYSGVDGSLLYRFWDETEQDDSLGASASGAGHVNGDGYDDLIAGAPTVSTNGLYSGSARVYSGIDGSLLYSLYGANERDQFGYSVSGAGDVNGDGYDDFIVGSPEENTNGFASGSARVYSGLDGSVIHTFHGETLDSEGSMFVTKSEFFGRSVSGAGDVNGDGYDDVIVGSPYNDNPNDILLQDNSGSATVFSGIDGSVLYDFNDYSEDSEN